MRSAGRSRRCASTSRRRKVVIGTRRLGEASVLWRILDVPGWDSTIEEHRVIAMQAIDSADAFIVLSNATRPDLTEPQTEFLAKIREVHFDGMSKAFGVLTCVIASPRTPAWHMDF